MRVIAGTARGRRLVAPKGQDTRPTPDRVREALFSILGGALTGQRVLDLFAGTGALGIEAISRGATHTVFVEEAKVPVAAIRENLHAVGAAHAELLSMSAQRAVTMLQGRGAAFDVVFLDPPFDGGLLAWAVSAVVEHGLVAPGGVIVCEHRSRTAPPAAPPGFLAAAPRRYGEVSLTLLRHAAPGASA